MRLPPFLSVRGFSLIETTVMLSIVFILAGALSPIVSDSITTARAVKAKNDALMIAAAIVNLQKDLGADAFSYGGAMGVPNALTAARGPERLPDVMVSDGADPRAEDDPRLGAPAAASLGAELFGKPGRIAPAPGSSRRKWIELQRDGLNEHLVTNGRGYRLRQPGEYGGWNGPYLSARLNGDPWGNRYMVNTAWLDGGASAADSSGRARGAVFVLSPGANGIVETPFDQPVTEARAYGDDIVVRIQ